MAYKWMQKTKREWTTVKGDLKAEAFARAYMSAECANNASLAAIKVGFKAQNAAKMGSKMLRDERVIKRLTEIQRKLKKEDIATVEWRKETLQRIADNFKDSERAANTAIAAISELNKMTGDYAPIKSQTVNLNVDQDMRELHKLVEEHKKEY